MKQLLIALNIFIILPQLVFAQAVLTRDTETFGKAKVLEVVDHGTTTLAGYETSTETQTLTIQVLDGADKDKITTFKNDYIQLKQGDIVYVRHQTNHLDGSDYWSVSDPYRLDTLLILAITFLVLLFVFGGVQGVRGLASLIGSFFLIFYLLIPGIYGGYNAILVSIGVASLIIVVGSYITHGFNRTTTSAIVSMIVTVLFTGVVAYLAVYQGGLTGYSSEESMFLNLNTKGAIDMVGLLFGGIMIGLLGVLYDIAIGQAIAIEELLRAGKHLTRPQIYKRGIRIGREHIGALVNTLAIAYVGASLPLILLMQNSTTGLLFILNSEVFATEITRILVGSIGLILAVPITTYIATHMLYGKISETSPTEHHHHH